MPRTISDHARSRCLNEIMILANTLEITKTAPAIWNCHHQTTQLQFH